MCIGHNFIHFNKVFLRVRNFILRQHCHAHNRCYNCRIFQILREQLKRKNIVPKDQVLPVQTMGLNSNAEAPSKPGRALIFHGHDGKLHWLPSSQFYFHHKGWHMLK